MTAPLPEVGDAECIEALAYDFAIWHVCLFLRVVSSNQNSAKADSDANGEAVCDNPNTAKESEHNGIFTVQFWLRLACSGSHCIVGFCPGWRNHCLCRRDYAYRT